MSKALFTITVSLLLLGIFFLIGGCKSIPRHYKITVDISDETMLVETPHKQFVTPISTSKFGVGGKSGSNRTPIGKFRIGAIKHGKFGDTVELHGKCDYGHEQRGRFIQIHKGNTETGSMGCIRTRAWVSSFVHDNMPLDTPVIIKR